MVQVNVSDTKQFDDDLLHLNKQHHTTDWIGDKEKSR